MRSNKTPPRVLLVANRLPVSAVRTGAGLEIRPSTGGLAAGLAPLHQSSDALWIGWPGLATDGLTGEERRALDQQLSNARMVPIDLTTDEVRLYYEQFANGALWPVLLYHTGELPLRVEGWREYVAVNERFADAIVAAHREGDVVWIHDFHLMLVPRMVRKRLPGARIGFFLHVPFPSSNVFCAAPHREELLEGLLGADLVGFHTAGYVRNFASTVLRLLGGEPAIDRIRVDGRDVRMGMFPMGIDAAAFAALADDPHVVADARALRGNDGCALLVGIDRLDYTKGIPRRLLAYEQLLVRHPELRGHVRLVQLAVPTRVDATAYKKYRARVDAIVGRIQGSFATPTWTPVHYMFRSMSRAEVVALYRAADVMLVTPIRDGMNLVAKEFVASRSDDDGVLVLSEFAGATHDLAEALHVNPYDVDAMADAVFRAIDMPREERRERMHSMRARVFSHANERWVDSFLRKLTDDEAPTPTLPAATTLDEEVARAGRSRPLVLLLDYDGTLVPFAPRPERATPDDALLALLQGLAKRAHTEVHLVSGRAAATLEEWFGALDLHLHGEHGAASRAPGSPWRRRIHALPFANRIRELLEHYAEQTPGAFVEEKPSTLAWHWRQADPAFGARQAADLRAHLMELMSNAPVEVLMGDCTLEVRRNDVHKGRVVQDVLERVPHGASIVAAGDDRTDEDMFAALPDHAVAIHVGPRPSAAPWRIDRPADLRRLLADLIAA